jgi:hypothetical protein
MNTQLQTRLWQAFGVILIVLTIGFATWKSQREWNIAHDCQCGSAYGRSSGDYVGGAVLQNALFIAPAVIGLLIFPITGVIIGILVAGASLVMALQNAAPINPSMQFQRDAMLVVVVLNLILAGISLYRSWKQRKTG